MRKSKHPSQSLLPQSKKKLKLPACGCILDSEEEIEEFWRDNKEAIDKINHQKSFVVNRNPANDFEQFSNLIGKDDFHKKALTI